MKKIIIFIVSLAVLFLINSCSECDCTTDPFDGEPTCYVYDSNGSAVAGAKIVINYDLNQYDSTGVITDTLRASNYSTLYNDVGGLRWLSDSADVIVWIQDY